MGAGRGFGPFSWGESMAEKTVLHGGCARCGSKEQEILKSVHLPGEIMGKALCDNCIRECGVEVD